MLKSIISIAICVLTAISAMGQKSPVVSIRAIDTAAENDTVMLELFVDMNDLATCDIFQVTVEIPYGASFIKLNRFLSYFKISPEQLDAAGKDKEDLTINAVTPYRKDERRMILIYDHSMQARYDGRGKFNTGKYPIGYIAMSKSLLGDSDKYRVKVVTGDVNTAFAVGKGSGTLSPEEDYILRLKIDNGNCTTVE